MEKKNVVIYVAGQRFSITTGDTPEYVMGIGEKIDVMIKGIQKDNPKLNRDACAILTALNICDDETKLRQMMEVLREQVKDYLVANENLRTENDALKKEIQKLKASSCEKAESTVSKEKETQTPDPAPKKKDEKAEEVTVSVPTKAESAVAAAVQRQTAFTGKDFRSGKNKKNKHKHDNNRNFSAPAAPASTSADSEAADEEQANSPFHQFSIFDDLM